MKSKFLVFIALFLSVYSCQNNSNNNSDPIEQITIKEVSSDIDADKNNEENTHIIEEESIINNMKDSLIEELTDENSLLIITEKFIIKFPNTMDYPIKKEVDSIMKSNQVDIDLFLMYCSDMFSTDFIFYPLIEDLEITKIEQQFSSTLFFNEDGSGGVWTIEGVEVLSSEWFTIEQLDALKFRTLSQKEMENGKPSISENSIAAAEEHIKDRELSTTYSEGPSENNLKIYWKAGEQESEFIINFTLILGD